MDNLTVDMICICFIIKLYVFPKEDNFSFTLITNYWFVQYLLLTYLNFSSLGREYLWIKDYISPSLIHMGI